MSSKLFLFIKKKKASVVLSTVLLSLTYIFIFIGQPSLRAEDRYRQLSNHRTGHPPVYPIKRKYSPDRSQSVEERQFKVKRSPMALITRERALFGDATRSFQRESSRSPSDRQAPLPTAVTAAMRRTSPVYRLPSPAYASPPMDEPLALIKKPGFCSPSEGSTATGTPPSPGAMSPTARAQQMRPSVITCVSSAQCSSSRSSDLPSNCCSAERALFGDATRSFQRESSRSPSDRQAPLPTAVTAAMRRTSPVYRLPSPAYASPPMDEPLALIKKPGFCSPSEGSTATGTPPSPGAMSPTARAQQMRPSVITCVSSAQCSSSRSSDLPSNCCSAVVEEHFRRSLGKNYSEADSSSASINISVDDHFAKALGEKWLQVKATSPPNSPSCASSSPARANSLHSPVGASRDGQQSPVSP
ncbi:UNVERIFIED_CONTAM: hypothetical protein FKN15_040924 [Acipenser sinensis]